MKCSFNCNLHNTCCNSVHWKFNIMFGGGKPQWSVLKHNGPMFPPKYIYLKIPITFVIVLRQYFVVLLR